MMGKGVPPGRIPAEAQALAPKNTTAGYGRVMPKTVEKIATFAYSQALATDGSMQMQVHTHTGMRALRNNIRVDSTEQRVIQEGFVEINQKEVCKQVKLLLHNTQGATRANPVLARCMRIAKAIASTEQPWIRLNNLNLPPAGTDLKTHKGPRMPKSLAACKFVVYVRYSLPTEAFPTPLTYVGSCEDGKEREYTMRTGLNRAQKEQEEGLIQVDQQETSVAAKHSIYEWRKRGVRFFTVVMFELNITKKLLGSGRKVTKALKNKLNKDENKKVRARLTDLERWTITQMKSNATAYIPEYMAFTSSITNANGCNHAGDLERGKAASKRPIKRGEQRKAGSTPLLMSHPGIKHVMRLLKSPIAGFRLIDGQYHSPHRTHAAPGIDDIFTLTRRMSQHHRKLVMSACRKAHPNAYVTENNNSPTPMTAAARSLLITIMQSTIHFKTRGYGAPIGTPEPNYQNIGAKKKQNNNSMVLDYTTSGLQGVTTEVLQRCVKEAAKPDPAIPGSGITIPEAAGEVEVTYRSSPTLALVMTNQAEIGRAKEPIKQFNCKCGQFGYQFKPASTLDVNGRRHLATANPYYALTRNNVQPSEDLRKVVEMLRKGVGFRPTPPTALDGVHKRQVIERNIQKWQGKLYHSENMTSEMWLDPITHNPDFANKLADKLMQVITQNETTRSKETPTITPGMKAEMKRIKKQESVSRVEKDRSLSFTCKQHAHRRIMEELSGGSYTEQGDIGGPQDLQARGKIEAMKVKYGVLRTYHKKMIAAHMAKKANLEVAAGEEITEHPPGYDPSEQWGYMYGSLKLKGEDERVRPITSTVMTRISSLHNMFAAILTLMIPAVHAAYREMFTSPQGHNPPLTPNETICLRSLEHPMPVLTSSPMFAAAMDRFNKAYCEGRDPVTIPLIDLEVIDAKNCFPSINLTVLTDLFNEFCKEAQHHMQREDAGKLPASKRERIQISIDPEGVAQLRATWTSLPSGNKADGSTVITISQVKEMFKLVTEVGPFTYNGKLIQQTVGVMQGGTTSTFIVNEVWFGMQEFNRARRNIKNKEFRQLRIDAGLQRYLDDCIAAKLRTWNENTMDSMYLQKQVISTETGLPIKGYYNDGSGTAMAFVMESEGTNYQQDGSQKKVAYLDHWVYQSPSTGKVEFHLLDKRNLPKHDSHPVLRQPHTQSFMWTAACIGTLMGELNRCHTCCSKLSLFIPCASIMMHEDHRRGVPTNEIKRAYKKFWKTHAPLYPGNQWIDPEAAWKDAHGLMCYLHDHGAEALEIRNTRIQWWPEGWNAGPPEEYHNADMHPRLEELWFVQKEEVPHWA